MCRGTREKRRKFFITNTYVCHKVVLQRNEKRHRIERGKQEKKSKKKKVNIKHMNN